MGNISLRMPLFCCFSLFATSGLAATVTREVLIRDHLGQTTRIVQVTGTQNDSSAGSWDGLRPGGDGLPVPAYDWTVAPIGNRRPLSPVKPELGWPARMAGRLDLLKENSITGQRCSGMLVGPRHFLTGAHCVLYGPDYWVSDSLCVRPGYNLQQSAPGYSCVRVVASTLLRSAERDINLRESDDDWALLELANDVGMEVGWAQIVPIRSSMSGKNVHVLGYPQYALPTTDPVEDTTSKTDTICHSWAPLLRQPELGSIRQWTPDVPGWPGESGSPIFYCLSSSCKEGPVRVIGTRWTEQTISSIDSVNSGILAALLKGVKIPSSIHFRQESAGFALSASGGVLYGRADVAGQWQVMSLDGRSISSPGFGQTFSVDLANVPNGVALVVFRAPGQPPVTRRWVGR